MFLQDRRGQHSILHEQCDRSTGKRLGIQRQLEFGYIPQRTMAGSVAQTCRQDGLALAPLLAAPLVRVATVCQAAVQHTFRLQCRSQPDTNFRSLSPALILHLRQTQRPLQGALTLFIIHSAHDECRGTLSPGRKEAQSCYRYR